MEGHLKHCFTLLDSCASSLRRSRAKLLCIVPILTDEGNPRGMEGHLTTTLTTSCVLSIRALPQAATVSIPDTAVHHRWNISRVNCSVQFCTPPSKPQHKLTVCRVCEAAGNDRR